MKGWLTLFLILATIVCYAFIISPISKEGYDDSLNQKCLTQCYRMCNSISGKCADGCGESCRSQPYDNCLRNCSKAVTNEGGNSSGKTETELCATACA